MFITSCDRYDLELSRNIIQQNAELSTTLHNNAVVPRTMEMSLLPVPKIDQRCNNRGSAKRQRYSMKEKWDIIERCDETIASEEFPSIRNPTQYFQYNYRNEDAAHKWVALYGKWTKPEQRERMVGVILGKNFASKGKFTRSPFHHLETILYNDILTKRKSGHRVSNTFIRIRALAIFKELKEQGVQGYNTMTFKASNGWRTNFIKRRKLKYRRKKSGKLFSANDHIPKYLDFLKTLRFKILCPRDNEECDEIYGRFPPSRRYNMDQVPLPFVVSQEFTFTLNEDVNIHMTCPSEALRKRQWTMHCIVNAGAGDDRHAWVDLVSKGTGKQISKEETSRYNKSVGMFWQQNAWVDGPVMIELAKKFVQEKVRRHGNEWICLFADNLRAHLLQEVKEIFGSNQVLLIYFPPSMTEMVQPIDAGYGRSLRSAIGRELDAWLMDSANLIKWESKMTAMERRILISHLVSHAQDEMLLPRNDKMRIGCFERTGCLITKQVCEKDALIKPQGVTVPFTVPVLPPSDAEINHIEVEPEPCYENEDIARVAAMLQEVELDDAELILNNDNDILQEEFV